MNSNTGFLKKLLCIRMPIIAVSAALALTALPAVAGPFSSDAVAWNSGSIVAWATGYQNYVLGTNVDAVWQTPQKALGVAGNSDGNNVGFIYDIACLGNGGKITLTFNKPITDGPGADFLVFENSYGDKFLELAFVEVSSDGTNFTRFPNISFTPSPVSAFGDVDPTNIYGYGGKYKGGFGTPFDLNVLAGTPGLDINKITHVKIIDIVGGTVYDTYPLGAHLIYDPTPTTGSGGFDLDAVGVIHQAKQEVYQPPEGPFPLEGHFKGSNISETMKGI
jgi:hypothetical protein